MAGTWSLSTTVRNPERIKPFLKVLAEFEGVVFNEVEQANFFKRLIKYKLYTPTISVSGQRGQELKAMFEDSEPFTDEEVNEILSHVHYTNKQYNDDQEGIYGFRGRTAVGNLNKMGVAIAREAIGNVQITELGKRLLDDRCTFAEVMFRYFLKWQLPNPAESGYKGFNINPFISTLHVINKVNKREIEAGNKAKGISKEEFALFIVTLTDYSRIDEVANSIINFRKNLSEVSDRLVYTDNCFRATVISLYGLDLENEDEIVKKVNNLYDYADSAIRYFRQTNLLYYRGAGRYVDLSPTREVEINALLGNFDGSAIKFKDLDEYLDYLADINKPELPWENRNTLVDVYANLKENISELQNTINTSYYGQALHSYNLEDFTISDQNDLTEINRKIAELREIVKILSIDLSILQERSLVKLGDYINELNSLANRKRATDGSGPLNLEWFTSLTLMALDDAKEIKPNLIIGDDMLPIFTAPGNGGDIECHYEEFGLLVEVTLLKARDQWFNEGQPVMRHLRDFEDVSKSDDNYCLFVAPTIHRDTLNTFWMGVKMGYEGSVQKIIPLTIEQYTKILSIVKELNNRGIRIKSPNIKELLNMLFESHNEAGMDSTAWVAKFDSIIEKWGQNINL
ncbi:AlwI family type II restriction endonuclease [Clostridium saccharoperbutylacetonicum]|uniref:AlwI family type II restriction endonuclease n=1 Tax=Clostridium saccharoperbutylacetonicum TaxID=36745 RepID=UPI0039E76BFC